MCFFESTLFKEVAFHPDESQILTTGADRKVEKLHIDFILGNL